MPDQLDLVRLKAAELRDRGLGEPRRDADPQFAGDELQKRPPAGLVQGVEPARDASRKVALAGGGEGLDHLGEARHVRRIVMTGTGAPDATASPGAGQISATVSARSPT